jgi:DNA helicase-2/ATP-dependent DNA helicase PcrA
VYAEPSGEADAVRYLVVDWKTSRRDDADELQLALYRLAWAELAGVPLDMVRAAFYFVRSGQIVDPPDLPGREELERLVRSRPGV